MELHKKNRLVILALLFLLLFVAAVTAAPTGPSKITYVSNSTMPASPGVARSGDERGTITTVLINVTQQSLYWKAYVGNVTGKITLDDISNYTIFDWTLAAAEGEVYATRKTTSVTWTGIKCVNNSAAETESLFLNHTIENSDSLNSTFGRNNHPLFYVGNTLFPANRCNYTINTYVNDTSQASSFKEVLLYDTTGYVIYTALLNDSAKGYNNKYYDFQMLVGEKGQDGSVAAVPYYFYVELT